MSEKDLKHKAARRGVIADAAPPPESGDEENDEAIGRAFWRSLAVIAGVGAIVGGVVLVVTFNKPVEVDRVTNVVLPRYRATPADVVLPRIPLIDVTKQAGIDFTHVTGKEGEQLLPETMGGGGGFLDYDNDGDQDILLVNSKHWPWSTEQPDAQATMKLYRNDGTGRFEDVTETAGLAEPIYGMGPAFGDYDGDGWTDIYVTAVGKNRLYHNIGGERFEEVAEQLGVAGEEDQWGCPAMWFDYDRDGRLDLLVGRYVRWNREQDLRQGFTLTGLGRAYGQPTAFGGTFLSLYHNTADGFVDVSENAGLQVVNPATSVPEAKSLAVAMVDADRDGWLDIVVANDTVRNFLFINKQDGTFVENGYTAGVAVDRSGMATGAMGLDVAHYRNDEDLAIAIGNFANEPSSLYISSSGYPSFTDAAASTGFGPQTKLRLTFGLFFADMDLDGRQDILCANGHLEEDIGKVQPTQQYEQPPQLFYNAGPTAATELVELGEEQTGPDFQRPMVGRGACYADIDGDGDLDVLLIANGQPAVLFRNDVENDHRWLRIKLKGAGNNPEAIGAEVAVRSGDDVQRRRITPTRSYLSQCELPATFGFSGDLPKTVEITWPDGSTQEVPIEGFDRTITIEQST